MTPLAPPCDTLEIGILVIEDHEDLREITLDLLAGAGYRVSGYDSVEALIEACPQPCFDIALIDIGLPGESGLSLARRLRAVQPNIGILMVTAHTDLNERLAGYDCGADLYLCKPVPPQELIAALAALVRRLRPSEPAQHPLAFDRTSLILQGRSGDIALRPSEANVLQALSLAPERRLETWQLLEQLGKPLDAHGKAQLEVLMSRLRKKLITAGAAEPAIKALRKCGYRLCVRVGLL